MIWELEIGMIKKQLAKISSGSIQLSNKLCQLIKITNQDLNQFIKKYIDFLADYNLSAPEYNYLSELWTLISVNIEKIISLWEKSGIKTSETRLNEISKALSQDSSSLLNWI